MSRRGIPAYENDWRRRQYEIIMVALKGTALPKGQSYDQSQRVVAVVLEAIKANGPNENGDVTISAKDISSRV